MTDEERRISVITNAIAYAVETWKPHDGIADQGVIYIGDVKTQMYADVARHVIRAIDEYVAPTVLVVD